MRKKLIASVAAAILSAVPVVNADPVNYQAIPSDALGFVHLDVERLAATYSDGHAMDQSDAPADDILSVAQKGYSSATAILARDNDLTILVRIKNDLYPTVSQILVQGLENIGKDKGGFTIDYHQQSIQVIPHDKTAPGSKPTMLPTSLPFPGGAALVRALGFMDTTNYFAFVPGSCTVVITSDLATMTRELDVLAGRSSSIATSDAHHLKIDSHDALLVSCVDAKDDDELTSASQESSRSGGDDGATVLFSGRAKQPTDVVRGVAGEYQSEYGNFEMIQNEPSKFNGLDIALGSFRGTEREGEPVSLVVVGIAAPNGRYYVVASRVSQGELQTVGQELKVMLNNIQFAGQ